MSKTKRLTFIISLEFSLFHNKKSFDIDVFQNICKECVDELHLDTLKTADITRQQLKEYKTLLHNKLKDTFN